MQVDDELLLGVGEQAPLEVRPQVVGPPQPAALPAPQQPCTQYLEAQQVPLVMITKTKPQSVQQGGRRLFWRNAKQHPCVLAPINRDRGEIDRARACMQLHVRTGELGHGAPAALAVAEDEADELLVLLRRPRALLQPHLVAARLPAHGKRWTRTTG